MLIRKIYKAFCLCLLCAMLMAAAGAARAETRFIDALGDVPLMSEMWVDEASILIFDKADGRYVELIAFTHNKSMEAVKKYYKEALPALGWNESGKFHYKRGTERLDIGFATSLETTIVTYRLMPIAE